MTVIEPVGCEVFIMILIVRLYLQCSLNTVQWTLYPRVWKGFREWKQKEKSWNPYRIPGANTAETIHKNPTSPTRLFSVYICDLHFSVSTFISSTTSCFISCSLLYRFRSFLRRRRADRVAVQSLPPENRSTGKEKRKNCYKDRTREKIKKRSWYAIRCSHEVTQLAAHLLVWLEWTAEGCLVCR